MLSHLLGRESLFSYTILNSLLIEIKLSNLFCNLSHLIVLEFKRFYSNFNVIFKLLQNHYFFHF